MKKEYRVKKNEDFQSIIHQNKKIQSQNYKIYYALNNLEHARVGISTSKKLGIAVLRNRIRRQVRASMREIMNFQDNIDYIIIVKNKYLDNSFEENKKDLSKLLEKIKEDLKRWKTKNALLTFSLF